MTAIIVNDRLRRELLDLSQPLRLTDDAGNVVAYVTPTPPIVPTLSAEELQRREAEEEYSTAEVLAHLEAL